MPECSSAAAAAASTSAKRSTEDFFTTGGRHVTPYAIAVGICGMVSSEISISLGLRGMSHVLSCGCTSSTDAIGYAASLIRAGEYDVLLSGGTDGCVLPGMIFGFSRMRAVSTHYNDRPADASRPFDRGRDGFVLGEGAWMFVLEREDRARARGATRYARIEGYASTCDAYHRVQMDPDGGEIVRCIDDGARQGAPQSVEEIGYINYHGTSTQLNDAIESRCVRRVFGRHADRVPGSSTKSMIGHPQGASGAAGVVDDRAGPDARRAAADHQPRRPDPACDMDFIPNTAAQARRRRRALQLPRIRIEEQRAGHWTDLRVRRCEGLPRRSREAAEAGARVRGCEGAKVRGMCEGPMDLGVQVARWCVDASGVRADIRWTRARQLQHDTA